MKLKTLLAVWGMVAVFLMAEIALAVKPGCAGIENKSRGEQFKLKRLHECEVPEVTFTPAPPSEQIKQWKEKAASKVGYPPRPGRPYREMSGYSFEFKMENAQLVVGGEVVPNPTWQKFLAGDRPQRQSAILQAACYGSATHLQQALEAAKRMEIYSSSLWIESEKPGYRESALHCAAWLENFDKVKMLIKHGFYPAPKAKDSKGGSGKTPKELARSSTPEGRRIIGFLNEAEHIWELPENERKARIELLVLEYDRATPEPEPEKKSEKVPTLAEMLEEIKKLEGQ